MRKIARTFVFDNAPDNEFTSVADA